MKKLLLLSALLASTSVLAMPDDIKANLERNGINISKSTEIAPALNQLIVKDRNGREDVSYLINDRYLVIGNLIDVKTEQNLSAEARKELTKIDLSLIEKSKKVKTFEFGKGAEAYYVFVDPTCPHCESFLAHAKNNLRNDVKLIIIATMLPSHTDSKPLLEHFFSLKKLDLDTYLELSKVKDLKKGSIPDDNLALLSTLKVPGTPAVYDKNGYLLQDYGKVFKQ